MAETSLTFKSGKSELTFNGFDHEGDMNICHTESDDRDCDFYLSKEEVKALVLFLKNKLNQQHP